MPRLSGKAFESERSSGKDDVVPPSQGTIRAKAPVTDDAEARHGGPSRPTASGRR